MKIVRNLIKNNFFLIFGSLGILYFFLVLSFNLEYDAPGIKGLLYWSSQLAGIIVILPREIILFLNDGETIPYFRTICVIIGLCICVGADFLLRKYLATRGKN